MGHERFVGGAFGQLAVVEQLAHAVEGRIGDGQAQQHEFASDAVARGFIGGGEGAHLVVGDAAGMYGEGREEVDEDRDGALDDVGTARAGGLAEAVGQHAGILVQAIGVHHVAHGVLDESGNGQVARAYPFAAGFSRGTAQIHAVRDFLNAPQRRWRAVIRGGEFADPVGVPRVAGDSDAKGEVGDAPFWTGPQHRLVVLVGVLLQSLNTSPSHVIGRAGTAPRTVDEDTRSARADAMIRGLGGVERGDGWFRARVPEGGPDRSPRPRLAHGGCRGCRFSTGS